MIEFYEFIEDESTPCRCDVELDWIEDAPQSDRPWLLWLFIKSAEPLSEAFALFSRELKFSLKKNMDAVFAGSIIKEGWVEFYFYAPESKRFENLSSEVMNVHGGFPYERGSSKDPKWEMYREHLFPDAYALIRIQNRHTINALIEAGDDLVVEREVEHYLFFQTKSSLERAVEFLNSHGFMLKEQVQDDENDYAYGAILIKNESITIEQVEESTSLLFETAMQEHGHYEGWSTVLAEDNNGAE